MVVYTGMAHGWTVPDMPPAAPGKPIYNKPEAERAWTSAAEALQDQHRLTPIRGGAFRPAPKIPCHSREFVAPAYERESSLLLKKPLAPFRGRGQGEGA